MPEVEALMQTKGELGPSCCEGIIGERKGGGPHPVTPARYAMDSSDLCDTIIKIKLMPKVGAPDAASLRPYRQYAL